MILELKNINKSFKRFSIFENLNLSLDGEKIYGIVGRNGSGKSVLFKIILGLYYPDSGEIFVNGEKLNKGDIPNKIGAIIESPGFLPNITGFKNLKLLAEIKNKINDNDIIEILKKVELEPNLETKVRNYSLGMIQKLAIAQALMESPKLVILDEPFNGLDKKSVDNIRNLISDYKKNGTTFILSSHIQEDIDWLCDEVYEIDERNLVKIR